MSEPQDVKSFADLSQQLASAIDNEDWMAVDNLWLELLVEPPTDVSFYDNVIRAMRRAKALERAHELLLLALDELEAREQWEPTLGILKLGARFWPDSKALRPHTARALKRVYSHIPQLPDMIAACKGLPLDRVFMRFEELLRMLPGEVYSHPYWGNGYVVELDIPNDRVMLEFPEAEEQRRREVKLDFLLKHLRHRPQGSFTARLLHDRDALRQFAWDAPAEFVKLVLADFDGRLKASELKELLLESLFSEAEWSRWWSQARTAFALDSWIDFDAGRGGRAEIALRNQPRTFEDEVLESYFASAATLENRVELVKRLAKTLANGAQVDDEAVEKILSDLTARLRNAALPPAERLTARYLVEILAAEHDRAKVVLADLPGEEEILVGVSNYLDLRDFTDVGFAQRALRWLVARDGEDGIERAAASLPEAPPALAQALWSVIMPEKHAAPAVRAIRALFEKALDNPETFVWAARHLTERRWSYLDDFIPLGALVFDLLDWLNEWEALAQKLSTPREVAERAKWLIGRVRSLISAGDYAVLAVAVRDMPLEQVHELRRALQLHNVFTDSAREAADRAIRLVRRDLDEPAVAVASSTANAPASTAFLCTARGLARAAAELHELNTVTIPQNAKEIEKARAEGDLRENAGYHGARERHAHLLRRAHFLQDGIARAQVVRKDDVNTAEVSFGTRVILTNLETGSDEIYTLLGQWESDPERGIFDHKAPFPAQLLGKKVGDEFEAQSLDGQRRRFRVKAIDNALASGEWDEASVPVA
ncbi:MAG: GreA/GreB family elongation factor [Candidatus Sumerlaeaceae bacterium]